MKSDLKYNFKNTRMSQAVMDVVIDEANEKIADLILTFAKQSTGVFYGEMRLSNYKNQVLDLGNKIAEVDDLLRTLGDKNDDELKEIASTYEISDTSALDRDNLIVEIEKKLISKLSELRSQTDEISSTYTKNNSNTFEYTMNKLASGFRFLAFSERNVNSKGTYELIASKFESIINTLGIIHSWNDAISKDTYRIVSIQDEILDIDNVLITNQEKCYKSTNDKEKYELYDAINKDEEYKEELKSEIESYKANLVNLYGEGKVGSNFVELEIQVLNDLHDIQANVNGEIKFTYINNELVLNNELIEKYITAFHEFFEILEYKELELNKCLIENGIEPIINKVEEKEPLENQLAAAVNRDMEAEKVADGVMNNLGVEQEKENTESVEEEVQEQTEEVTEEPVQEEVQEENPIAPETEEPQNVDAPVESTEPVQQEVTPVVTQAPKKYKNRVSGTRECSPDDLEKAKAKAKNAISFKKVFTKIFNPDERPVSNSELMSDLQGNEGRTM